MLRATSPLGDVTHLRCKPGGGADIAAEGYAECFGEPLGEFELPAAGGELSVKKTVTLVALKITVRGVFKVKVPGPAK